MTNSSRWLISGTNRKSKKFWRKRKMQRRCRSRSKVLTILSMEMKTTQVRKMMRLSSWESMKSLKKNAKKRSDWKSLPKWRRSSADSKKRCSMGTPCSMRSSVTQLRNRLKLAALAPTQWSGNGSRRLFSDITHEMSRSRKSASLMTQWEGTSIDASYPALSSDILYVLSSQNSWQVE